MRRIARSAMENMPSLARMYRNVRELLDRNQPSKKTPWGFVLAGHDAMARGDFEPEETRVVRALMAEVDILVNIGANVGYYCCHALSLGKPVVAVEPNNRNLHYLLKNIRNNGWNSLAEVFPVALGAATNIMEIWGSGTGASLIKGWAGISENHATRVPILSLDRVLGDKLYGKKALIVVDIEGAEFMMLKGATKALMNEPRPIWLIEITTKEHQPAGTELNPHFVDTFELFYSLGYKAFAVDDEALEITAAIIKNVAKGSDTLKTHNFLFCDR